MDSVLLARKAILIVDVPHWPVTTTATTTATTTTTTDDRVLLPSLPSLLVVFITSFLHLPIPLSLLYLPLSSCRHLAVASTVSSRLLSITDRFHNTPPT